MAKKAEARPSELDGLKIGLNDAAKLIGKSIQHVRNLVRDGFIVQEADKKYLAIAVATGALKAREAEDSRASKTASASRLHDERTEEIRLRNADRQKVLIEQAQAEVIRVVDEIAGPLKSDLMAIPAQVTTNLKLRRVIEDRIDGAFGAAAKRANAAASRVPAAGQSLGTARTRNARRVGAPKPRVSAKRRQAGAA